MTYYEEFGVRQNASLEEIRRAYKLLARILHPDSQRDSKMKALAECQMKRLGELAAILSNPRQRREYDDSLLAAVSSKFDRMAVVEARPVPTWKSGVWGQFTARYGFWILMGLLVLALGFWDTAPNDSNDDPLSVTPRLDTTRDEPGGQPTLIAQLPRADHIPSGVPVDPPIRAEVLERRSSVTTLKPTEHSSGSTFKEIPSSNPITAFPNKPVLPSPLEQQSFAGRWVYSPALSEAMVPGQYAANFVEFSLAESGGSLLGDYRAQYRIPDRAMSSEVAFRVIGPVAPAGTSATLSWTSRTGATGMAKLILKAPNVMRLAWWTTHFGPQPSLASGTAVLIRQVP